MTKWRHADIAKWKNKKKKWVRILHVTHNIRYDIYQHLQAPLNAIWTILSNTGPNTAWYVHILKSF